MQTNFWSRLGALIRKEFNQIRRDRRLAMSLIVPPTLQLLLFGFALDSTVSNLRLGVVDDARSPESRELSAVMTQSKSFRLAGTYSSAGELGKAISQGDIHAEFRRMASSPVSRRGGVLLQPAFLYNPGLVTAWFIVTGTFGTLLILNGSLVASTAMIKEREAGTVEQLLMTPAGTTEIVVA